MTPEEFAMSEELSELAEKALKIAESFAEKLEEELGTLPDDLRLKLYELYGSTLSSYCIFHEILNQKERLNDEND